MQFPDHGERQGEDADIAQKRQTAIHGATDRLILARATRYGLVVVECDGRADGEIDNPRRDSPGDGVCHVGVGEVLELLVGEEADVKEEDGEFDADQSRLVDSLQGKGDLGIGLSDVHRVNGVEGALPSGNLFSRSELYSIYDVQVRYLTLPGSLVSAMADA